MNLRGNGVLFSMAASMATPGAPDILAKYLTGQLDYLPYVRNPNQDQLGMAPFSITASRDYSVEVLLETVRRKVDPLLPSRLSCVFAFGSRQPAIKAARRASRLLEAVYEFELADSPLTRVARANFEIVTLLRQVMYAASWDVAELEAVAEHYWRQGGEHELAVPDPWRPGEFKSVGAKVTWEYLVEGRLDRVGGPLGYGKLR
jgi:hypothetical protein